jgi:hypothetical protein
MNRAVVYLLGAILLLGVAVVGGGLYFLVGAVGDAGTGTPTLVEETPLPLTDASTPPTTATQSSTAPTRTATPTVTGSPTPAEAVRTRILPRRFDQRRIEVLVVEKLNERRTAEGLEPLTGNGTTSSRLRTMARSHSVAMADSGVTRHEINGTTGADRYRQNELYRLCRWEAAGRESIISADNNGYAANDSALEAVGRTYAGREYDDGQFNEDERAVAGTVVDEFFRDYRFERRLTLPDATHVGVGAEITRSGEVYVTVALCTPT